MLFQDLPPPTEPRFAGNRFGCVFQLWMFLATGGFDGFGVDGECGHGACHNADDQDGEQLLADTLRGFAMKT